MNTYGRTERRTAIVLILAFVLLVAGIVTTGSLYYRNYEKQYRAGVENQLSAIANLKVSELAQFRNQRLADAAILFSNASFPVRCGASWETRGTRTRNARFRRGSATTGCTVMTGSFCWMPGA